MSFKLKILSFVVFGCFICTATAIFISYRRLSHEMNSDLIEKSQAILTRLESSRKFVANQGLLDETIRSTVQAYPNGNLPDEVKQKVLNVVPIYAALKIGMDEAEKDHYKFRVAATEARRHENEATPFEKTFLDNFENDRSLKEQVYQDEKNDELWVMRPVFLKEKDGCINCHGNPSTSPYKNGKDVLGFKMENWADGHLHGMFVIISSTKQLNADIKEASTGILMWSLAGLIGVLFLVSFLLRGPISAIGSVAARLKGAAEENQSASDNLSSASQSVASSTTEQAAGVQETMASMAEMTSMVAKTQELAGQTLELTGELDRKSKSGTQVMQDMVNSMGSIKKSNEELKKMVQIINDISTKTNVINDIVFKTQLLSVNASIEAARAGQHGKGFAVVAEEVGNLALVSGKAAEEIRDMLAKSQSHVNEVVAATTEKVQEGEKVSQEAMRSFEEITHGINKIQGYSQSVSEAMGQQQEGITQIGVAMTQMDQASQSNSEMSTNVSRLADSMTEQSQLLLALAQETQHLVYGKNGEAVANESDSSSHGSFHSTKTKASTGSKTQANGNGAAKSQNTTNGKANIAGLRSKLKMKQVGHLNGAQKLDPDSDDFGSKAA